MATVTGLTAARMLEIEASSVTDGEVVGDNLILARRDGTSIDAGNVRGPQGLPGINGTNGLPGKDGKDAAPGSVTPTPNTTPIRTANGRVKTAPPTEVDDATTKAFVDDQFRVRRKAQLLQRVLTGGGVRKVDINGVAWSQRFMLLGAGRDDLALDGYFEVTLPPDGTVIPMYGNPTLTSVTVSGGRVPVSAWTTLYYEVPLPGNLASVASRFRLVEYRANMIDIPSNWIMVVTRNGDLLTPAYTWGDGVRQDFWRNLTLSNSWVNYNAAWPSAAWKFTGNGEVVLRGMIAGGAANTVFTTFNTELAPANGTHIFLQSSYLGQARVDAQTNGGVAVNAFYNGGSNTWVALQGVSWSPAGA